MNDHRARWITLPALLAALVLLLSCEKEKEVPPLLHLTADIEVTAGNVRLVLRNASPCSVTVCRRNFYDMIECLDVRRYPDTAEFTHEQVFGKKVPGIKRQIITLDDFEKIGVGGETRIPIDLRCIAAPCKLGDSAFIAVFFKNIDPYLCSKVDIDTRDKAVQDYCKLLHVIPTLEHRYWSGEVRTPYRAVRLCSCVPQKVVKKKRTEKVTIIRRSKTHPLDHQVF